METRTQSIFPDAQDSTPLHPAPQDHPIPEKDSDSSGDYCKETDTHHLLVDLLEQFQQFKKQFASLRKLTPPCPHP